MNGQSGKGTADRDPPSGLVRWFLRLPIGLYRLKLGWLLGRRFLLLVHTGRKSGKPRNTVLEVLRHEPDTDRCIIASGWGTRAQWYRNVMQNPQVRFTIGLRDRPGRVAQLPAERAVQELRDYGGRHPAALGNLTRLMIGETFDGSPGQYGRLAERVPVLELAPASVSGFSSPQS